MHFGLPRRVVALASLVLLDAPVLISLLVSSVAVAAAVVFGVAAEDVEFQSSAGFHCLVVLWSSNYMIE